MGAVSVEDPPRGTPSFEGCTINRPLLQKWKLRVMCPREARGREAASDSPL